MHHFMRPLAAATILALLPLPAVSGANDRRAPNAGQYSAQYDGPGLRPGGFGPSGDDGPGAPPPGGGYGSPDGPDYAGPAYRPRGGSGLRGARSGSVGFVSYHGFRIRPAHAAGSSEGQSEIAGAESQIAIVERAGLSASAMRLFRSQPIDFGARSMFTREAVILGGLQGGDTRPVLLHEFMHVYHRSRLPGGFGNPTIQRYFQEALASGRWPEGSYMLSNVREYFAMTASCFLNGTVARPPFTREAIRENQPEYYAYLAQLFGHGG